MPYQSRTLRIEIDERWATDDMLAALQALNYLYDLRLYLNFLEDLDHNWGDMFRHRAYPIFLPHLLGSGPFLYRPDDLHRFSRIYFSDRHLSISRISYSSPGIIELIGDGTVLVFIYHMVKFLVMLPEAKEKSRLENERRVLGNEEKELDNRRKRIENARAFTQLNVEHARVRDEIRRIEGGLARAADEEAQPLMVLIEDGKITGISILDESGEPVVEG